MPILAIILGALANAWAGYEKGDRYTGGLGMALAGLAATGEWTVALALGLGFIGWRLVGWQGALDMGRNEGSKVRDVLVMFGISLIPAVILCLGAGSLGGLVLAPLITLCYYGAMWWLPWEPKYSHIKVAELASGAMFVAAGIMVT